MPIGAIAMPLEQRQRGGAIVARSERRASRGSKDSIEEVTVTGPRPDLVMSFDDGSILSVEVKVRDRPSVAPARELFGPSDQVLVATHDGRTIVASVQALATNGRFIGAGVKG
jgi:hypothetical protein